MSVLHRNRNEPDAPAVTTPPQAEAPPQEEAPSQAEAPPQEEAPPATVASRPAARTRTSAAWLGACLAAVVLAVLIVFMLQNTGSVEVSFLWLHGSLPLAIALLIAGVGASLLTMIVGVARITQLRRRIRQHS
jgi:uncharacterized integral membrane protein